MKQNYDCPGGMKGEKNVEMGEKNTVCIVISAKQFFLYDVLSFLCMRDRAIDVNQCVRDSVWPAILNALYNG